MIVIVGSPVGRRDGDRIVADGPAALIAMGAAAASHQVQVVGRIGDDAVADAVLQDLARAGVGHVATLRDPARATPLDGSSPAGGDAPEVDGADVDLALRYLTDFRVIVVVDGTPAIADVARKAAGWAGAALVATGPLDAGAALPPGSHHIEPEAGEDTATFARRVAGLAVALDTVEAPRPA